MPDLKRKNKYKFEEGELDAFLNTLREKESSGGKDFNHPVIKSGMHKGTSAIGNFGLMPRTTQDFLMREKKIRGKVLPEDLNEIANLDPNDVEAMNQLKLKLEQDPDKERRIARMLAETVLKKHAGDEERAAWGWKMGTSTPSDKITDDTLNKEEYIQAYRKNKPKFFQPEKDIASTPEPIEEIPEEPSVFNKLKNMFKRR